MSTDSGAPTEIDAFELFVVLSETGVRAGQYNDNLLGIDFFWGRMRMLMSAEQLNLSEPNSAAGFFERRCRRIK